MARSLGLLVITLSAASCGADGKEAALQWWIDVARNGTTTTTTTPTTTTTSPPPPPPRQLLLSGAFGAHALHDPALPAVRVEWSRSPDSVGYSRTRDPKHDKAAKCIHPAPFGVQCTTARRTVWAP